MKYIIYIGKVLHFPVAREGETHKITPESRTSRRCRRPRLAPRGRPHTGQNAICGTIHVRMVLWRRRKLNELALLFKTTVWQFKIQSWSSTSQVIIIIPLEMPKMVADNQSGDMVLLIKEL